MARIGLTDARRAIYLHYQQIAKSQDAAGDFFLEADDLLNVQRLVLDGENRVSPPKDPWASVVVTNTTRQRQTIGPNPLIRTEGAVFFQLYLPTSDKTNIQKRLEAMAEQLISGIPSDGIKGFSEAVLPVVSTGNSPVRLGVMYFGLALPTERPPTGEYALYVVEVPFWYEQRDSD